ncbi:MAG: hypothetical protein LIO65_05800 [Odoribacter sp.]|nr:hypothetical protein [Odoribacter sp.]
MDTTHITIRERDWKWNELYNRFECVKAWTAIDEYVYEVGAVQAGVFVVEQVAGSSNETYETLKMLPFVQTYYAENDYNYTETISYDLSLGAITFYIQTSDPLYDPVFLDDYTFKVNIIWHK